MNRRSRIALLTLLLAPLLAGCDRIEPITKYQTPKEKSLGQLTGNAEKDHATVTPTDRILAAIIPQGQQAWVFRLTGPVDAVGKQLESFKQLVQSTHFEADEPKWTLPTGWTQQPASGLRYATIDIPGAAGEAASPDAPPLDLSVSMLPGPSNDLESYLLANVNRWRGQLALAPLPLLRLGDAVQELKCDGCTATLVDLSGNKVDTGMTGGPMAPGGPSAGGRPPARPAPLDHSQPGQALKGQPQSSQTPPAGGKPPTGPAAPVKP